MPERETSPVTTRSLAAALGVSRTTVSRALRGDPSVAKATRERVRKAAQERGYQPDVVLSKLASNRWRSLPDGVRSTMALLNLNRRRLSQAHIEQARKFAADYGYALDALHLGDYPDQASAFRVIKARGIRAVLLWAPDDPGFEIEADVSDFILLAAPVGMKQLPLHTVSAHHYRAGRLVTQKLAELGFQRPGLVVGLSPRNQNLDMVVGAYRAEWDRQLFEGRMPSVLEPKWSSVRFHEWMERERPDAIISAAGTQFIWKWLKEAGIRVPGDISLACIMGEGQTAGAYVPREAVVKTALAQLHARSLSNEYGLPAEPTMLYIEPQWREGKSVLRPPQRGKTGASD